VHGASSMFTRHLPFRKLFAHRLGSHWTKAHVHCSVFPHMHVYILYIYMVWWEEALVGSASQVACGVSCMFVAVCDCMHACTCVSPELRVHAQVAQACTQGSLASLTCHLDFVFFKEAIFVRRHMYLLVYSICVYVGICQEADVHPLCICMQSKKWLTFLRRFFLCLQLLCIRWLGLPTHCSSIYWHPYVR